MLARSIILALFVSAATAGTAKFAIFKDDKCGADDANGQGALLVTRVGTINAKKSLPHGFRFHSVFVNEISSDLFGKGIHGFILDTQNGFRIRAFPLSNQNPRCIKMDGEPSMFGLTDVDGLVTNRIMNCEDVEFCHTGLV
jgi:hypothetical protein